MADQDQAALQAIQALTSLSADHRRAVVRAYYLGQSVEDIAADDHLAQFVVKAQLHDALCEMARALRENDTGRCA